MNKKAPPLIQATFRFISTLQRNTQIRIWFVIIFSILVILSISTIYYRYQRVSYNYFDAIDDIQQSRIDISTGFLYLFFAKDSKFQSPYYSAVGLTLIKKSITSFEHTLQWLSKNGMGSEYKLDEEQFRNNLLSFGNVLDSISSENFQKPSQIERIRLSFYNIDRQASALDKRVQVVLRKKTSHLESIFSFIIVSAAILISFVIIFIILSNKAREKSDRKLRDITDEFTFLFDTMTQGVIFQDSQSQIIKANRSACDILGLSMEQLLGKTTSDPRWKLIFEDGTPIETKDMPSNIALKTGKPVSNVVMGVYLPEQKIHHWILTSAVPKFRSHDCKQPYITMTAFTDVTIQKNAKDALKESERDKSQLLERMNEAQHLAMIGSWEWDLKTDQIWWSDEIYRIFGVSPRDYTPSLEANSKFIYPDDLALYNQSFEDSFKTDVPVNVKVRLLLNDGQLKHCNVKGKIIYDNSGKPNRFAGTIMDITEQKLSEETLQAQNNLQNALMKISASYINLPLDAVESTIHDSLGELAELVQADKAYIFDYDFQKHIGTQTHEWCREGMKSQMDLYRELPILSIPDWDIEAHCRGETIWLPDISSLPPGKLKEMQEKEGTKSLLALPLMSSDKCLGFVSFNWINSHHTFTKYEHNYLTFFAGMLANIIQRKQMEEKLRTSEINLKKAQEIAKVGSWISDLTGRLKWSDEMFRIFGVSSENFIPSAESFEALLHPDDFQANQEWVRACKARENPGEHEFRVIFPDGSIHFMLGRGELITNAFGKPTHFSGTVQDITERKHAEDTLRSKTERLQNLHQTDQAILLAIESPEEIALTTLKHIRSLIHCQRASIGIFDSKMNEVRVFAADINGETIIQTGKTLAEEAYGDLDTLRQNKMEVVEDVHKLPSPSAVARIFQMEGVRSYINAPLLSAQGLIGALNVSWEEPRKITPEEKEIASEVANQITIAIEQARLRNETKHYAAELEERVRERTSQLQAANKELEAFSYSVSHDLRAPLRAVDGYTRILLEDYGSILDAEGKRVCSVISESARDMGKLIDDLLTFSRIGRAEMQFSVIDMTSMVQALFLELTTHEDRKHIDLHLGPLQSATGDPSLIRQVWVNLLSNAIKFSSKTERAVIQVSGEVQGEKTVYSIKDNGAGFDMQYIDKLFGVFQRLHSAKEFEGTGVGLAIVQRIIMRHGGTIWAEGEVGKGAVFYFSLPFASPPAPLVLRPLQGRP